jgi:hypothetical protein
MSNEKLEKLRHDQCVAVRKMKAAQHKEKYLQSQLKQLSRRERTHRLCNRAGMLEKFLREPNLLTDEDILELLMFLFHSESAQKKLDFLIEKRKKAIETGTA